MRAGLLNKIISVYKPVQTIGDYGDRSTSWECVVDKVRCAVKSNGQNLNTENGEIVYQYSLTFSLRYNSSISEYMRIYWEDRKYRITGIQRNPEYGELTINAELINE
jgi:SPP1 family predicted phage head-tail adaptor